MVESSSRRPVAEPCAGVLRPQAALAGKGQTSAFGGPTATARCWPQLGHLHSGGHWPSALTQALAAPSCAPSHHTATTLVVP